MANIIFKAIQTLNLDFGSKSNDKILRMKFILTNFLLFFASFLFSQTYQLDVFNGYGSGKYKVGDSVHIFANAIPSGTVFDKWSGDTSRISNYDEWHSVLVMPAKNVSVSANFKDFAASNNPVLEQIQGKNIKKPVYSAFPNNLRGVIFVLHGTGGSASNWVTQFENLQFVRDALADNFGVIITECEESTLNQDTNGDGKIRWSIFPADTISGVDYVNIRAIRDTFIKRGKINYSTPFFSVGMSDGGAYSVTLAAVFRFKSAVSYCAPGAIVTITATQTPTMFNMALYDNNPNVGPQGNADALKNVQNLKTRGICSNFAAHDRTPLYPERFSRRGDITTATSINIFNEFKTNGFIDANNYCKYTSDSLTARILANTTAYPIFVGLNGTQRAFVLTQIDLSYSDHQFYSDYNKRTLKFLKNQCASFTPTLEKFEVISLDIFPNPANDFVNFNLGSDSRYDVSIYDLAGQKVIFKEKIEGGNVKIDVIKLPNGIYLTSAINEQGKVYNAKLIILH